MVRTGRSGNRPFGRCSRRRGDGSSPMAPQTRGWSESTSQGVPEEAGAPADVGMVLCPHSGKGPQVGRSRRRGEGPYRVRCPQQLVVVLPETRGGSLSVLW